MDQPGKVAFAPDNLVSRGGSGSPVPRQPAGLHTQVESGAFLRDSARFPRRRPFIYLKPPYASDQSRVYRVTHLRTDGVHCRESAGTGPVSLKVVPFPNECCLLAGHHHGPINMRLFFTHHYWHEVGMLKVPYTVYMATRPQTYAHTLVYYTVV